MVILCLIFEELKLEVWLLDHMVILCLIFWGTAYCMIFTVAVPVHIFISNAGRLCATRPLPSHFSLCFLFSSSIKWGHQKGQSLRICPGVKEFSWSNYLKKWWESRSCLDGLWNLTWYSDSPRAASNNFFKNLKIISCSVSHSSSHFLSMCPAAQYCKRPAPSCLTHTVRSLTDKYSNGMGDETGHGGIMPFVQGHTASCGKDPGLPSDSWVFFFFFFSAFLFFSSISLDRISLWSWPKLCKTDLSWICRKSFASAPRMLAFQAWVIVPSFAGQYLWGAINRFSWLHFCLKALALCEAQLDILVYTIKFLS